MLIITLIVFILGHYGPGDPVEVMLGNNYTEELADSIREKKGLNDPLFIQYFRYVSDSITGDFGESYKYPGKTVFELLSPKLIVSSKLFLISIIISTFFGIPLGFYAAMKQGTPADPAIVSMTLILYAMPVFLTAPLLIIIFALELGWVPVSGWGGIFDKRAILPAITVGLPGIAVIARLMRASTLDVLGQEFITFAKAKGVDKFSINFKHVGRNAIACCNSFGVIIFWNVRWCTYCRINFWDSWCCKVCIRCNFFKRLPYYYGSDFNRHSITCCGKFNCRYIVCFSRPKD